MAAAVAHHSNAYHTGPMSGHIMRENHSIPTRMSHTEDRRSSGHSRHNPKHTSDQSRLGSDQSRHKPSPADAGADPQPRKRSVQLPNLLQKSKLGRAVEKLATPSQSEGAGGGAGGAGGSAPRLSSSQHRCWSSLRTREWQEFQRSMRHADLITNVGTDRGAVVAGSEAGVGSAGVEGRGDGGGGRDTLQSATTTTQKTPLSFLFFNLASPRQTLSTLGSRRTATRRQIASPNCDVYERARQRDFCLVEDAYVLTKQNKSQRWRDTLDGVPAQYNSSIKPARCKIVYDDHNALQKRIKMQQAQWREQRLSNSREPHTQPVNSEEPRRAMSRAMSRSVSCRTACSAIPGPFVFPAAADFVPESGTKIDAMGLDWRYTACHRAAPAPQHSHVTSGILRVQSAPTETALEKVRDTAPPRAPPRQHKASYNPVTSGLKVSGVTTDKLRGHVMTRDELEVTKVWKRKLTNIIIPADMAKHDIPERNKDGRGMRTQGWGAGGSEETLSDIEERRSLARDECSSENDVISTGAKS